MRFSAGFHAWLRRAWASPPGPRPPMAWALSGLETIYRLGRPKWPGVQERGPIPVVSVGSLWVGGAGKTPLAAELARMARSAGASPAIILRGYGGKPPAAFQRVPEEFSGGAARLYGDEACLHVSDGFAAVYVALRRLEGVRLAASEGANLAILDDGMQHRRLARDLEIVTLPAYRPLANGRLLPRGPLREEPAGLSRADLIVLAYAPETGLAPAGIEAVAAIAPGVEVVSWSARIELHGLDGGESAGRPAPDRPVALLCGIGNPDTFRDAVEAAGITVGAVAAFRDHHPFKEGEVQRLQRQWKADGLAQILTTEKDAVRLRSIRLLDEPLVGIARLQMVWKEGDKEKVRSALLRTFQRSGGGQEKRF